MKTITTTLILFQALHLFSQIWFVDNPVWHNSFHGWGIVGYDELSVEKDTFINGQACKKILQKWVEAEETMPADSSVLNFAQFAYEQGDKVYFYSYLDHQFHLTYDFSLEVGNLHILTDDECEPDTFFLQETGIDTIAGQLFRYQKLGYISGGITAKVIEKIGFVHLEYSSGNIGYHGYLNFNESYDCVFVDPSPGFTCFRNDYLTYNPQNGNCYGLDILNSSKEDEGVQGNILLFPNPVSDILQIPQPYNDAVEILDIIDMNGRLLQERIANGNNINLEALPSGIYTVRLRLRSGQIKIGRIIKL